MSAFLLVMIFVLILIGILSILMPDLVPKTLPFGVRILAEYKNEPILRKMKSYFRIYILILLIAFSIPMIYSSIYEQVIILFSFIVLQYVGYYIAHRRIHSEKIMKKWYENKNEVLVAEIATEHKKINVFLWILPSIIIILIAIISLYFVYPSLPNSIPMHFNANAVPDSWMAKTPLNASLLIILMAAITVVFYFLDIVILRSRIEIDPSMPEASSYQANAFKNLMAKSLSVMGWFLNITFLFSNYITWNIFPSNDFIVVITPIIIAVGIIFAVSIYAGAQGSRLSFPSKGNQDSEVMRDDDRYWIGGAFYFNREDRAIIVPKRFGIGWTLNLGNIAAWFFFMIIILLALVPVIIIGLVHL